MGNDSLPVGEGRQHLGHDRNIPSDFFEGLIDGLWGHPPGFSSLSS